MVSVSRPRRAVPGDSNRILLSSTRILSFVGSILLGSFCVISIRLFVSERESHVRASAAAKTSLETGSVARRIPAQVKFMSSTNEINVRKTLYRAPVDTPSKENEGKDGDVGAHEDDGNDKAEGDDKKVDTPSKDNEGKDGDVGAHEDDGNDKEDDEKDEGDDREGGDDKNEAKVAPPSEDDGEGKGVTGKKEEVLNAAEAAETNKGGDVTASNNSSGVIATVAYAVSVTGCGSDPITEGAAVLKHSIHRVSSRAGKSKYDYAMFAIYHPSAEVCAKTLEKLGYQLMKRDVFIKVSDIQGDFLRENIEKNGCCGEKELIKLEAYTLTDYPIVVHLDLDVIVLKPMDDIFDMMILNNVESKAIMWPNKPIPAKINAFYTYDYNMVSASNPNKAVQGGFLVTRPDMAVYEEFREIVRVGDFRQGAGWGGKVGPFHGSMTFQGIVPYFYDVLHPGQSIELSRCIYNQMVDNPRDQKTVNDIVHGKCRTGEAECEDCRSRPLEDVVTTHFTLCQKPWWCLPHSQDMIQHRLCRKLTHEWYHIRSELEQSWGRSGFGRSEYERDHFFGFCDFSGHKGYQLIQEPYKYGPVESVNR